MGNKGDYSISCPKLKMEKEKGTGRPSTSTIIGKASPEIFEQDSLRKMQNHRIRTRTIRYTVKSNSCDAAGEVTSL
jgi:hypothetical protein